VKLYSNQNAGYNTIILSVWSQMEFIILTVRNFMSFNYLSVNKIKHDKYHTVGTIPNSNIKIVERSKSDTLGQILLNDFIF
jgi:hypothetical protein